MQADPIQMERIADGLRTKSAKIRALSQAGFARADIARFLGVRYQHVRNVLTQKEPDHRPEVTPPLASTGLRSVRAGKPASRLIVEQAGLLIPLELLKQAGLNPGAVVVARADDGEITLRSTAAAIRRAQELVAAFVRGGDSLAESLLDDRRREVEREREDG
jgi:antitoxin component of MazEF toxin-antitoxin module